MALDCRIIDGRRTVVVTVAAEGPPTLTDVMTLEPGAVVIDLSTARPVTSSTVAWFFGLHRVARGIPIRVIGCSTFNRGILRRLGVDRLVAVDA